MPHNQGDTGALAWANGVDTSIAGNTTAIAGKLDTAVASGTYAPLTQGRPGNLVVFLGDSLTAGNDTNSNLNRSSSWPNYAAIISGQRIQYVYNAGVPGDSTASMLARFDTDVTPYAPNVVTLLCGTNDLVSQTLAQWSTTVQAIVAKIRTIGAVPVLATLPPTNTAANKGAVNLFNGWLRRYAAQQALTLFDFYSLLVDPATSDYKAIYFNDGTHPNAAGWLAMGNLASTVLAPLLPNNAPQVVSDDVTQLSSLFKSCWGGYTGTTVPTGWLDNAGVPSGSVLSYTTDAAVPGQLLTVTSTATAGVRQFAFTQYFGATTLTNAIIAGATSLVIPIRADYAGVLFIGSGTTAESVKILSSAGGGPQTETLVTGTKFAHSAGEPVIANYAPGDELIFSGVVTSDGGTAVSAKTSIPGAAYSPGAMSFLPGAITRGVFHQRFVLPAGSTSPLQIRLQVEAGTGVASFGRVGLYNATRLGI